MEKNLRASNGSFGFPCGSDGKESACNAGDPGSIPGSGRSPGEGNGNPLRYSCLENPMDREAWQATVHEAAQNWIRLKQLSTCTCTHTQIRTHRYTLTVKEHPEVFIEREKIKEVGKEKERDGSREKERDRVRDEIFWHYWKVGIEIYPGHMNCVSNTASVIARRFGLSVCIL